MTFYQRVKAAGLETDNHYSDLYVRDCSALREIMRETGVRGEGFVSQIDGEFWMDFPFRFDPYWKGVEKEAARRKSREQEGAA